LFPLHGRLFRSIRRKLQPKRYPPAPAPLLSPPHVPEVRNGTCCSPGPRRQEAHRALLSTLHKCEKMDRAKLGKSQRTLLERRIAALGSALWLIERECGTP